MKAVVFALPILPGRQEAWRRCLQEMLDVYRYDYEALQRQLGLTSMAIWLTEMPQGTMMSIQIEAQEPAMLLPNLLASELPLASFLQRQVLALHGLDLTQPTRMVTELILESQVS